MSASCGMTMSNAAASFLPACAFPLAHSKLIYQTEPDAAQPPRLPAQSRLSLRFAGWQRVTSALLFLFRSAVV